MVFKAGSGGSTGWEKTLLVDLWGARRTVDDRKERTSLFHFVEGTALVLSAAPVASPTPSPALDEGELLRDLAEAPLSSTALVPGRGVTWTPIDTQTARATLTHGETTASLTFHFKDRNEVERVSGRRGFMKADGTTEYRPWKGYWRHLRGQKRDASAV